MKRRLVLASLVAQLAAPAAAVGLGPLVKQGLTDGPAKAFYLTLINPYPDARDFRAYPTTLDDQPIDHVEVIPSLVRLGGNKNRKLIVIARDIEPGQTFTFRVCAELQHQPEGTVHARVCSKLSARRIAAVAQ